MRHPDESEEQFIDRLLSELGIRLPMIDMAGDESLETQADMNVDEMPLAEELSGRRTGPFA